MAGRHRRSVRLPGFDYRQPGAYFVTICTSQRECLLGTISECICLLTDAGHITEQVLLTLPHHFPHVRLGAYCVMPNHVHGVIHLVDTAGIVASGRTRGTGGAIGTGGRGEAFPVQSAKVQGSTGNASPLRARNAPTLPNHRPPRGTIPGSLAAIVQTFKAISARRINVLRGTPGVPVWQRSYYEHAIRDEDEQLRIAAYILNNPGRWAQDHENPVQRDAAHGESK